jgi:hypothetical protein
MMGDTVKGVKILTDLFLETKDIAFIYMRGRCLELNGRYEDAIGYFREFLIKEPKMKAEDKAEAERHIAACESHLAKRNASEPEAQASPRTAVLSPPPEMAWPWLPGQPDAIVAPPPPTQAPAGK